MQIIDKSEDIEYMEESPGMVESEMGEGHAEEDMTEDERAELAGRLNVFASRLARLASEQVGKRTEIESRWLEDLRQFHGEYSPESKAKLNSSAGSEIFVNITRNKTNAAEARLQDMLYPTDDRNFGIGPTPVPELADYEAGQQMTTADGQEMSAEDLKAMIVEEASKRSDAMQEEIDDQLSEARYQLKSRDIIHDACQLGTGIIKGPVIVGRMKKSWETMGDGTSILKIEQALTPSVERVDPWDFFPDMSARTIDEAEFVFERRRLSKKQLRDMSKLPGIMVDQLRDLVKSDGSTTHLARDYIDEIRTITGINTVGEGNKYEIWEYHGPISKSELMDAMTCCDDGMEEHEIDELDDEIEGIVFFSGNSVLKVAINPMETDDRTYSVFNWEKDDSAIFGFGVPFLMRNPQRVINASWRMMMDNSGMSASDQLIINRELVYPADNSWTMGPKKIWFMKDKTRSVQEVFASFSTPSHQRELQAVFEMARQLADEETSMPLIAQGEQTGGMTQTSSGMAMLMNSANIVLRRAVKNWDDDITRPLITRFYDWNMQFSSKKELKGDFYVDARGSGALLVREKQQENLMIYANISAGNPELAARRDWAGLDREIAKSLEVPYDQLTLSEAELEEIKAAQAEQGANASPEAQMMQMETQVKQAGLQLETQKLQMEAQKMQLTAELRQAEMQHKAQMQERDFSLKQALMAQERELKIAEFAAKAHMSREQLEQRTMIETQKIKTDRDKAATNANIAMTKTQLQATNLDKGYDTF